MYVAKLLLGKEPERLEIAVKVANDCGIHQGERCEQSFKFARCMRNYFRGGWRNEFLVEKKYNNQRIIDYTFIFKLAYFFQLLQKTNSSFLILSTLDYFGWFSFYYCTIFRKLTSDVLIRLNGLKNQVLHNYFVSSKYLLIYSKLQSSVVESN